MTILLFVILTLFLDINYVLGGKCYQCSTLTDGIQCYNLKDNITSIDDFEVDCLQFCTVRREEYSDLVGGVAWLNRSCEAEYVNYVSANGHFISFVRSCNLNLCNYGSGVKQYVDMDSYMDWDLTIPMKEFEPDGATNLISLSQFYNRLLLILLSLQFVQFLRYHVPTEL